MRRMLATFVIASGLAGCGSASSVDYGQQCIDQGGQVVRFGDSPNQCVIGGAVVFSWRD